MSFLPAMTGNGKFIPIKMVTLGVVYDCLTNMNYDKVPEGFGFLLDGLKTPIKICPTSCLSLIFICRSHLSVEAMSLICHGMFSEATYHLSTTDFRTKSICHWSTSSHMFVHPEPCIYICSNLTYIHNIYNPLLHIQQLHITSTTPSCIYNIVIHI